MKPRWWEKSKKYVSKKDRVMFRLIRSHKGHLTTRNNFFYSLSRSIVSQQISTAAADSVFSKFQNKCKGKINPKVVSKLSLGSLRKCGLSRQKALGIKSLSEKILDKSFNPRLIKKMNDEEAIIYLSSLRQLEDGQLKWHFFSFLTDQTFGQSKTSVCLEPSLLIIKKVIYLLRVL